MFRSFKTILGLIGAATIAAGPSALAVDATVDAATQYQTVHGFGACLYNPNMGNSSSVYTNETIKSLYVQDLGCSILRVSVEPHVLMASGGNLAGPEVSLGSDLNANAAKFNWEQSRHRYYDDWVSYLTANALEPSRVKVFASVWSPPHWAKQATGATVNGQPTPTILYCNTCDTAGGTWKDSYFQYNARFMSGVVKSFENHTGVSLYALSIQNEVIYEQPFNSCTLAPSQTWSRYANALKAVKDEWATQGLTTKIMGPHHANLGFHPGNPHGLWVQTNLINAVKAHSDTGLDDFWEIYTNNYAADKAEQARMFDAYQKGSNNVPGAWASWAGTVGGIGPDGKETWNSEAGGHAATFDGAMDLAHDANNQMVWANQSAWIYWQYADGDLLSSHNLLGTDQFSNPTASKKYVAFKQFSRYIRPGSKRVKLTFSNGTPTWGGVDQYDTANSLSGSAYVHSGDGRVTIVLVNMSTTSHALNITVPTNPNVTSYQQFRTSATESFATLSNLSVSAGTLSFTIPARSIVTLTGTGTTGGGSLPSGWTAADIGSPSPAGSTSESSGSWTVKGGGADIWGSSDQFHYAYKDASGDTTVVARVDTLQNTNGWAKAGVMIRDGTAANARFAMCVVTPGNGVSFQWRSTAGSSATSSTTAGIGAPRWVRIQRTGNNFTASHSADGSSWTAIGSAVSISMPTATKAGLAVTSHANGTLCTATMSNVSVTAGGGGSPPAAPTGLAATAGNAQVVLNWSASTGATSYNVKRSTTSGSGYGTVGTSTDTAHTDGSLTNGTTYYYVVSAVNSNGESANSGQASATPTGGQVAAPSFSPVAGTYTSAQSVTISTSTPGASIRFTTDGTTPTSTAGTLYSGPVSISATTTLKAIAYASGMTNSSVTTGTYTISTGSGSDATIPAGTATVDGTVESAWSSATAYTLANTTGTISSSSDCSGTWKALWDSTNLYVLADVTDDNKSNDSTHPWEDDSVEVYLDGNNDKTTSYDANDRQYVFGWGDTAAVEGGSRSITGVTFAKVDPTSTSYRIEAKVPWATLGVTASSGKLVGIDVHVNDDDAGGAREGKKTWKDTNNPDIAWSNPSVFGTADLAAGTPLPQPPTNLAATAGDGEVVTNWTASSGATSYNVYRSTTSGSGYALIDGSTDTMDVDETAVNGTTYYYVVTAVNSAGESGNSNQASATPTAPGSGGTGLMGVYFNNITLTAPSVLSRTDSTVNFNWGSGSPATGVNSDGFSVRWTGQVQATVTGSYTFSTESDDGVRLWVNGTQLIDNWTNHPATINTSSAISLTAGTKYDITMEYYENSGGSVARLMWTPPGSSRVVIPQAQLFPAIGPSSLFANAGFENDMSSWTNTGNSVTVTGTDVASGAKAIRTGTGQGGAEQVIPYTSGAPINVNVKAKIDGTISTGTCSIGVDFLDSSGAEISEITVDVTATSYTTWAVNNQAVPTGTASLRFWTWKPGTTGYLFVDDVVVSN